MAGEDFIVTTKRKMCGHGNWNRHIDGKGECDADRPSQSTGVNPSRKQKHCPSSCPSSQAQRGTYHPDNYQNLEYLWTILKSLSMYGYVKLKSEAFWVFPAENIICVISTETCRLEKLHNFCPLSYRLLGKDDKNNVEHVNDIIFIVLTLWVRVL